MPFDVQLFHADTGERLFDCGIAVAPVACVVSFVVDSRNIDVDGGGDLCGGVGPYTMTLDAQ